jgi:hypothetical protein
MEAFFELLAAAGIMSAAFGAVMGVRRYGPLVWGRIDRAILQRLGEQQPVLYLTPLTRYEEQPTANGYEPLTMGEVKEEREGRAIPL